MFASDKRFKVSLELAHSFIPAFYVLLDVSRELWVEKNGTDRFVTVEIEVEHKETPLRNRFSHTHLY